MYLLTPVSAIMTDHVITVNPGDKLKVVDDIFHQHRIHHIPVVDGRKIIGMISKSDLLHFVRGFTSRKEDLDANEADLQSHTAEEIMTRHLAKVEPSDRVNVVLEVFKENLFHAIPVVNEDDELVGIITTFDIIRWLSEEKIPLP